MYHIKPSSDPYSPLIARAVEREFPTQCHSNAATLVDLITAQIIGTKQQRYGPKPSPEVQVAIRDVIRIYMESDLPIPFLVPWGSLKPDRSGIDLAELWALKMLYCLHRRIQGHYKPGAAFNIRVEDASAPNLFFDAVDETRDAAMRYAMSFQRLVDVLELNPVLELVLESELVSEARFTAEAEEMLPAMQEYLTHPANSHAFEQLIEFGWKGGISEEMKEFYFGLYKTLYPEASKEKNIYRLSRYLCGSLARNRLNAIGDKLGWLGQYIELSFLPSPPGTAGRFGRRVYYRTLPSSLTRNHIPPWRAKGYILITDEDDLLPKLSSFKESLEYNPNTVELVNGELSVTLQADYIISTEEPSLVAAESAS